MKNMLPTYNELCNQNKYFMKIFTHYSGAICGFFLMFWLNVLQCGGCGVVKGLFYYRNGEWLSFCAWIQRDMAQPYYATVSIVFVNHNNMRPILNFHNWTWDSSLLEPKKCQNEHIGCWECLNMESGRFVWIYYLPSAHAHTHTGKHCAR